MGLDGPMTNPGTLFDSQGRDHLGDEVTAERSPERAVLGGVNGAFAHTKDEADGRVGGAASELRATLDESFVDEVSAGDDDESALAHLHGEDGAVFLAEVANDVDEVTALEDDLEEVSDERPPRGTRREVFRAAAGGGPVPPPEAEEEEGHQEEEEV